MSNRIRMICEGAVMIALAWVLSFFEIQVGFLGGSLSAAMLPIIVFAVRWGAGWGMGAGFIFGLLKYMTGGKAFVWTSILLDYSIAYMMVGLAGFFKGQKSSFIKGAVVGGLGRFVIHFISGITVYAIAAPTEIFGLTTGSAWLFSLLYNGGYMLPSIVVVIVLAAALQQPLDKFAASRNKG